MNGRFSTWHERFEEPSYRIGSWRLSETEIVVVCTGNFYKLLLCGWRGIEDFSSLSDRTYIVELPLNNQQGTLDAMNRSNSVVQRLDRWIDRYPDDHWRP